MARVVTRNLLHAQHAATGGARIRTTSGLRRRATAGIALVAALALSGCANEPAAEADTSIDPRILEDARAGGADAEQLATLESGQVTFEEYQRAVDRSLSCIRDAGIDVIGDGVTETRGFPEIQYSFAASSPGRSDEQTTAIADDCIEAHSKFVEAAYQTAPGSIEAQEAKFETYRPAIVECLRENGVDIDDDAAQADIFPAAGKLWEVKSIDCIAESGFAG